MMNAKNPCSDLQSLRLCIKIDGTIVYEFAAKVDEQSIIKTAKELEAVLKKAHLPEHKIQDIFEVTVEILQNILNYAYQSRHLDNDKREAYGSFIIAYEKKSQNYIITSCNLIEKSQEAHIKNRLKEVQGLDKQALRALGLKKMRHKADTHAKGAGLGFIKIAKKACKPLVAQFLDTDDAHILQYRLTITL